MGCILTFLPFHQSLRIFSFLCFISLIAGCSPPLPNLHSNEFSEFYNKPANLEEKNINNEWDRFAGVPIELKEDQFGDMVVKSSLPVTVEFYVTWCDYCEKFKPTFEKLAKKYEGKVRFATIDAEKNESLKSKMGVVAFPAFFVIKDGYVLDRWYGTRGDEYGFEKHLKSSLSKQWH